MLFRVQPLTFYDSMKCLGLSPAELLPFVSLLLGENAATNREVVEDYHIFDS